MVVVGKYNNYPSVSILNEPITFPDSTPPVAVGIFLYNRIDEAQQIVKLIRLGKHAELFG